MPPVSILFATGGSGGHLFPAIAVAEELSCRTEDVSLTLVISDKPIDQVVARGVTWETIMLPVVPPSGLRRAPWRFLRRNFQAWREAVRLVDEKRPAVVVGCGGFASVPVLLAARSRRIPIVLLEQNAIPGRVTRWRGRRAQSVCCTDPASLEPLRRKGVPAILTGNPVRREIAALARRTPDEVAAARTILVLGGSQGAHAVNRAMIDFATSSADLLRGWSVVHQTGDRDRDAVAEAYRASGVTAEVGAFFGELADDYARAGLAVSRAGATTLAELSCAGIPSILIPYPQAADDHQRANARTVSQAEGGIAVEEAGDDFPHRFTAELKRLLQDEERRRTMSKGMRQLAAPEAARVVADVILRAARP